MSLANTICSGKVSVFKFPKFTGVTRLQLFLHRNIYRGFVSCDTKFEVSKTEVWVYHVKGRHVINVYTIYLLLWIYCHWGS